MTFMDDFHHDTEEAAMKAVRTLQLWLGTIAPVPSTSSIPILEQLLSLAREMQWETEYDDVMGITIVKGDLR